jgi:hypothetical protein
LIKIISDTPWYIFILCLTVGALYSLLLYFKEKRSGDLSKLLQNCLIALRFVSVSLICILLAGIFLKHIVNHTEDPLVLLAVDNSTSIVSNKDSIEARSNIKQSLEKLKTSLSEKFTIKQIVFGERTRQSDSIDFKDKETDIFQLINDINNNYAGQNVGALIIASDGIINKGANPIYLTDKLKFPVYTIALGDTNEVKDVSIQKIDHNQVAYLGNQFVAQVNINAVKFIGQEINISVLKNNIKKGEQKLKINSNNYISSVNFVLEADAPGLQRFQVNITPLKEETNILNNSQSFMVDVIDNRDKILIVANSPHPDIAALSESIESLKNYEIVKDLSSEPNKLIKAYSLVIIHNYNFNHKRIVDECVTNKIPYFIINPAMNAGLTELKVSSNMERLNDAEPKLNKGFGLFTISDELKKLMNVLPAVKSLFGKYTVSNGSQILIQQQIGAVETTDPILLFNEVNGLKSAVFAADGLWKWRLRNFQENGNFNAFTELISKSIQFLAVKSDKSFFRVYTEKFVKENEVIEFNAEVYNKSYELITEPDVTLVLKNEIGKTYNYTFSKTETAYRLNAGYLPAGEYAYEAKTKINEQVQIKKGLVIVKPVISEKINTVADHALLNKLSTQTNGKLFYLNNINELNKLILSNESIKPITYSQNETSDLIDLKWLFALIVVLLTAEWFIRKYSGLI